MGGCLGDATGWTPFEGNRRLVERNLLAHSRRWIARQLECSGYGMPETDTVITLLRSERPDRDNDLAWLLGPTTAESRPAKRLTNSCAASRAASARQATEHKVGSGCSRDTPAIRGLP